MSRFHPAVLLLVAVGFAAALVTLVMRYRTEASSRVVSLVLDYAQFRAVAAASGTPPDQAYHDFKAAGITGVAVTEETLADLESAGLLRVNLAATDAGYRYHLDIPDPTLQERVFDTLTHLAPGATESAPSGDAVVLQGPGGGRAFIPGRFEDLRTLPTGLDAREIAEVREAGLEPVGRILNSLPLNAGSLRWSLTRVKESGIGLIIFGGEEVLGYRGLLKETAQAFRDLGLVYGSVEFGKQRGDEPLSRLLLDRMVRVHSISAAEMNRLPETEAVERYVRAPAERNIRVNYVRLPGVVTDGTYVDSLAYVRRVARGVAHEGFGLRGQPVALGYVWASPALRAAAQGLIALGIGAGAILLAACLVPISRRVQAFLAGLAGLACAAGVASGFGPALQLTALLAAIVFPTLAFVLFPQPLGAFDGHEHLTPRPGRDAPIAALYEFLATSTVTLAGALLVAGLLSELPYLIKVRSFAGIKAATVAPILLVAWVYLTGMSGEYPDWKTEWAAIRGRLEPFLGQPIRVGHSIAIVLAVAALALLVMRSGNDPGVGVSELEIRFRSVLDRVLGVRPRTKEFLLGHPALWLALGLAVTPRWRKWALPLLLVGAIGQTGLLNSFCHLHSPVKLTVIRTFHGLWIGSLLGALLLFAWNRFAACCLPERGPRSGPRG